MAKREGTTTNGGPGIPPTPVTRDPNNPVHFGAGSPTPFVDDRINDPNALRYAQNAAARRRPAAAIPRYSEPVAGGPDLPIPRLDGEAVGGMSMSDQAARMRGSMPVPNFGEPQAGGIVEGASHLPPAAAPRAPAPSTSVLPSDMLPPPAQQDPAFQQGHGSMFAINQPHLARKYGVVRNGQHIPPQQLSLPAAQSRRPNPAGAAPKGSLSPETLEGLQALEQFQKQREQAEPDDSDTQIEEQAKRGPAGAAGSTDKPLTEEAKKELLDEMDEFDLNRLKNALFKDLLNNDEQKKIIEARLKPLDLGDLVVTGRVTQVVPIQPGQFEPEFQSYTVGEDLKIKQLIHEEDMSLKPSERYLLDKFTLMGLTVSLKSINKKQFPDYRDSSGEFSDDLFWRKFKIISNFNFHLIGSLVVNWFWFDMRVRKLFKAEALGNG